MATDQRTDSRTVLLSVRPFVGKSSQLLGSQLSTLVDLSPFFKSEYADCNKITVYILKIRTSYIINTYIIKLKKDIRISQ